MTVNSDSCYLCFVDQLEGETWNSSKRQMITIQSCCISCTVFQTKRVLTALRNHVSDW